MIASCTLPIIHCPLNESTNPMPEPTGIKVVFDGPIVRLILDRPKQLNALNDDIRQVISSTLNELMERPDIRLLVLSGVGKSFCAGADLKTTSYPPVEGDWSTRRNRTATGNGCWNNWSVFPRSPLPRCKGMSSAAVRCWRRPVISG